MYNTPRAYQLAPAPSVLPKPPYPCSSPSPYTSTAPPPVRLKRPSFARKAERMNRPIVLSPHGPGHVFHQARHSPSLSSPYASSAPSSLNCPHHNPTVLSVHGPDAVQSKPEWHSSRGWQGFCLCP
ncbi:hypothetical protein D9611_009958 [Ephemerocybe angulata]|uniref:Uncharacterized protein n=1 Tax=Ephemerocybe angulata TaxID=980116 RepID=A0A8H5C4G9_9AGAR|nr:hypothetical protein D9611_009958 [Tulosesus angulatus]